MAVKRMEYWKKYNEKRMMRRNSKVLSYWKLEMIVLSRMLTEMKLQSLRLENNWTQVMMVVKRMEYWKKYNEKRMMRRNSKVLSYWILKMIVLSRRLTEKKL